MTTLSVTGGVGPTFCDTTQEVLVAELRRALPQRDHTSLNTDGLELRAVELVRTPCQLLVIDIGANGHLARVDLQDAGTCGLVW